MKERIIVDRINKGIRQAYDEAQCIFPRKITWDEINTKDVAKCIETNPGVSIWNAFYLPKERLEEITKECTKGTRYTWRWPRRSEIGKDGSLVPDPEWDEYKEALEAKSKELVEKKISRKEFNVWQAEMAKKYKMQRRSYDKEKIEFNIWNIAPDNREDWFLELKKAYELYSEGISSKEAAERSVKMFTEEDVNKEYNKRIEMLPDYENDTDWEETFLSKEIIRNNLEGSYNSRIDSVTRSIEIFKKIWDEVLSKK